MQRADTSPPAEKPALFHHLARKVSDAVGSAGAFWAAVLAIAAWAATGPIFGFSDTWQLVVNTATTIVTFLIVFLIQHTQNRDNRAVQLKLDELIKAIRGARTSMIDLDRLSDDELRELEEQYKRLCARQRSRSREE